MKVFFNVIAMSVVLLMSWCMTTAPQKTSLELQAFQSREFETTKKIAFASVLSVFQDFGYIISSAEIDTGFVTAKSPTQKGFVLFVGSTMKDTKATAFVE